MSDVLIVYSLVQWPPVAAVRDALYAFERHSGARCWYVNLAVRGVPRWLSATRFDAIVFHTSLLWDRVNPPLFARHRRKLRRLAGAQARRVALPQDEYLRSRALVEFIAEFGVEHVFSVGPEGSWQTIYHGVDRERVGFSRVLTGYLDPETVRRIDALSAGAGERPIAIGYRAARVPPSLGRHGHAKLEIAARVAAASERRGLPVDIAIGSGATIRGDDWYRFLASCRYTLGVEGGASVLDPDGTLQARTVDYLAEHPGASFEEVEAACFPGRDGELDYVAISPRHLEAAATRTVQILIEGGYNGILRPGEHYLALRADFSNLDEVLDVVEQDGERMRIAENAYRDLVASGAYTHASFVANVLSVALRGAVEREASARLELFHRLAAVLDRASWIKVALYVRIGGAARRIALRLLPEPVLNLIRRSVAGSAAESAALQSSD